MHAHKHISIQRKEVHVWSFSLTQPALERERLSTLSDDERIRAGRFHLYREQAA